MHSDPVPCRYRTLPALEVAALAGKDAACTRSVYSRFSKCREASATTFVNEHWPRALRCKESVSARAKTVQRRSVLTGRIGLIDFGLSTLHGPTGGEKTRDEESAAWVRSLMLRYVVPAARETGERPPSSSL